MKVLFRTEGSLLTGLGHVSRCVALSEKIRTSGGESAFLMTGPSDSLTHYMHRKIQPVTYLDTQCTPELDAQNTIKEAEKIDADWIVLDGYVFSTTYQKELYESGYRLLVIDDDGRAREYWAHIILNQNADCSEELYDKRPENTSLLLGAKYSLIRKEFQIEAMHGVHTAEKVRTILVSMGGGDNKNAINNVVRAISHYTQLGIKIIVIGLDGELDLADEKHRTGIQVIGRADNMSRHMANCDLAVSAAGSTCWELCSMGVPSILLVNDDNQKSVAEPLAAQGAAFNLGRWNYRTSDQLVNAIEKLKDDPQKRNLMAKAGKGLIDGNGCDRVLEAMNGYEL